jgi:SAM-dependent methyltransferase
VSLCRAKALGRNLQEWLERGIIGTRLQEWIWRTRHLYRHGWAHGYLETIGHPHRNQIVEAVSSFSPVDSVLEVGCASGANLVNLRERLPGTQLIGIDINRHAIAIAQRHFAARGDKNIRMLAGRADRLTDIPNASVDVVLIDAVLMFIAPDRIRDVVAELGRVARQGLVLNEYHCAGEKAGLFDGGRWVYDLVGLLAQQLPNARIQTKKSAFVGGAWDVYGTLIEVRL